MSFNVNDKVGSLTITKLGSPDSEVLCDCGVKRSMINSELNRQFKKDISTIACGQCGLAIKGKDLVGNKYHHLNVIDFKQTSKGPNEVLAQCDCGSEPFWVQQTEVRTSRKKACGVPGCPHVRRHSRGRGKSKHSVRKDPELTRLFKRWENMHHRCYNEDHKSYKHYGDLGVTVGPEWHKDTKDGYMNYEKWFLEQKELNKDIEDPTVDRINGSKVYSPATCRLASKSTQSANQSQHLADAYARPYKHVRSHEYKSGKIVYGSNIEFNTNYYRCIGFLLPEQALVDVYYRSLVNSLMENILDKTCKYKMEICTIEESRANIKAITVTKVMREYERSPGKKGILNSYVVREVERLPMGYVGYKYFKEGRYVYSQVAYPIDKIKMTILLFNGARR